MKDKREKFYAGCVSIWLSLMKIQESCKLTQRGEEDITLEEFYNKIKSKFKIMITLNGLVKFRNRRIPIFWTGEFAQHLSEKNNNEPDTHPYLHVQAQKLLQVCTEFKKAGKSYVGTIKKDGRKMFVVFFIKSNFAIIKTCYNNAH